MVKNPVKVYARLRNINLVNEATVYSIRKKEDYDILTLYKYAKQRNKYKFHQIFDQNSSQEDVYENTTRPILNSVLHGFNGTIFAYGQTGSGKTYSMTGCSDEYDNRGIIPRCIQEIFQFTNKSPDQYTMFISYMEIYNEIGYDLLNPKHHATKLEELPRVTLLDDGKGEAHLRNLFMLPVLTEQEAMRLLFLGDTNRTIAETPMNDYSSRSHCIFTIYITRTENERKIRKSKLNLVDLAGSERIYKTNITGATLAEAKNINLSLHYLEQVILALSQSKRSHIPFRNSLMTYMLRDSLSGNSITVMLATLSIKASNLEETVTTCNFSQRVALVNTDATINKVFDPQEEIDYLRNEVTNLREKLTTPSNIPSTGRKVLSESEIEFCETFTENYLETGIWNDNLLLNLEQCVRCFQIFRDRIINKQPNVEIQQDTTNLNHENICARNDIIDKFKEIIKQKDEEIDILTQLLETYDLSKNRNGNNSEVHNSSRSTQSEDSEREQDLVENERLFEDFLNESNNDVQLKNLEAQIDKKCQTADQITGFVEICQQNILQLRRKLETGCGITDSAYLTQIQSCLKSQQDVYAASIDNLKKIKEETDFLEHGLKQERIRLEHNFKRLKKKPLNNTKHSTVKSTSDSGIFTRINESLRNIERKFSAKVKIQSKKSSPKQSESESHINTYEDIRPKGNIFDEEVPYSEKQSHSDPHIEELRVVNSYVEKSFIKSTYQDSSQIPKQEKYLVEPMKVVATKRPVRRYISTAKMMLPAARKSSDKWDVLQKQQNELYSSYGDPPGNITRLVVPPINTRISCDDAQHKRDETLTSVVVKERNDFIATIPNVKLNQSINTKSNHQNNINKSSQGVDNCTTANYSKTLDTNNFTNNTSKINSCSLNNNETASSILNCKEYAPELKAERDHLSDKEKDLIFEQKIQSYLKMIPNNPRKDTQSDSIPNIISENIDKTPHSSNSNNSTSFRQVNGRASKRTIEYIDATVGYQQNLNSNISRGTADNFTNLSLEGNSKDVMEDSISNQLKNLKEINDRNDDDSTHVNFRHQPSFRGRKDIAEKNDCYNKQVRFSCQTESSNYEETTFASLPYSDILQAEHIPEKDFTISNRSSSSDEKRPPEQHQTNTNHYQNSLFTPKDYPEFIEFMQSIPLTGDADVDEEIVKFYRTKFTQD